MSLSASFFPTVSVRVTPGDFFSVWLEENEVPFEDTIGCTWFESAMVLAPYTWIASLGIAGVFPEKLRCRFDPSHPGGSSYTLRRWLKSGARLRIRVLTSIELDAGAFSSGFGMVLADDSGARCTVPLNDPGTTVQWVGRGELVIDPRRTVSALGDRQTRGG